MADLGILKGHADVPAFNVNQELWIELRGQSRLASIYLKAVEPGVVVTLESGPDNNPANLDTAGAVTVTIAQSRQVERVNLPIPASGGLVDPAYFYYTRVRATGQVAVEAVSETPMHCYTRKRPELEA